jgi:hypothetical protein
MTEHLAGLLPAQPVVHRSVQMIGDLGNLPGRDESAHGYKTPVLGGEAWPQPEVPEQHVRGVLDEARRDLAELLTYPRRALRLSRLVERNLRT